MSLLTLSFSCVAAVGDDGCLGDIMGGSIGSVARDIFCNLLGALWAASCLLPDFVPSWCGSSTSHVEDGEGRVSGESRDDAVRFSSVLVSFLNNLFCSSSASVMDRYPSDTIFSIYCILFLSPIVESVGFSFASGACSSTLSS